MVTEKLPDNVAELAMERTAALLADRVANRVVKALMDANFEERFADALLRAVQKQVDTPLEISLKEENYDNRGASPG